MHKIIITLLCLFMLAGCATQQRRVYHTKADIDHVNIKIREYIVEMNNLALETYGYEIVNDMYVTANAMVIDYKYKAFEFSTLSIDKQLNMAVKGITGKAFGELTDQAAGFNLNTIGLQFLRVLIDGKFYKEYVL